MSIEPKSEERPNDTMNHNKKSKAEQMREQYDEQGMKAIVWGAEMRERSGFVLSDVDRFILDNKAFLLKRKKE